MKISILKLSLVLLALPFFSHCSKNNPNTVIPNVFVDVQININEPSAFDLGPIGGYLYLNGGSNGLIVYRADLNEFKCYDRHSPHNVDDWCQVSVDSTGFVLQDPCSGSEFSIFDGSILKGPSTIPLKQYPTTFDGTYILISNQ
ncbi:MAG: ubiquinol-cytochrome c reductase iron-sulfur subunit [Salibacteraceae bacterium]